MASTDARPVPRKNTAHRITFPIFDKTGALVTGAAGLDSELSKDAGTFADCTNEATEIATASGMYYLDLTSTEMNADTVAIIVKSTTTDVRTTALVLYPQESGDIRVDVDSYGGTAGTFSGGRPEVRVNSIATDAVNAAALATDAGQELADALLDRTAGIETSWTPRQALRLILSILAAKVSGMGTTTVAIRDMADSKDRVVATVDAVGNRSAFTTRDGT